MSIIDARDYSSIQAALNTGNHVRITGGNVVTAPLTFVTAGQRLIGDNAYSSYIQASTSIDLVRIDKVGCSVENIQLTPGSGGVGIRLYAGKCFTKAVRFISAVNNTGYAVVIQDYTPSSVAVPGAYYHTFQDCEFGNEGYAFARAIHIDSPTIGANAMRFINNKVWCDQFINLPYGGGNSYIGNTFQSSTGTIGTPAGTCVALGTSAAGEFFFGNYFERYAVGIASSRTSNADRIFTENGNNYDVVTSKFTVQSGITNYVTDNPLPPPTSPPPGGYSLLTGGTNIGNMTSAGGLSAAFDGNTSKLNTACAQRQASGGAGTIGKSWGFSKKVTRYKIYGATDYGFDTTSSAQTITVKLQGSNDGSSWNDLHTDSFADGASVTKDYTTGITTTTSYSYHQVTISTTGASAWQNIAQLEMYETL